jgi:hypothetical protein
VLLGPAQGVEGMTGPPWGRAGGASREVAGHCVYRDRVVSGD